MTAVDDIADLLRRTYTVYARNVPPIHDTVIAVLEEGGTVGKENIRIDVPFITVYVRSQSERQTLDTMQDIERIMLTLPQTINGTYYYRAVPQGTDVYGGHTQWGISYIRQQTFAVEVTP